jgi:Mrp family chromosome partitioning ATPase
LRIKKDDEHGLSNLLTGNVKVGDCLVKTSFGFDLVAGGAIPPNPAELIVSDSMQALLDSAAKHYDYIICDAPPVGIITDAAALSSLCDGVLRSDLISTISEYPKTTSLK